jgi:hypothetical protein
MLIDESENYIPSRTAFETLTEDFLEEKTEVSRVKEIIKKDLSFELLPKEPTTPRSPLKSSGVIPHNSDLNNFFNSVFNENINDSS